MPQAVVPILIKVAISTAISFGLSLITRALAPKPKAPQPREEGRKHIVRSSVEAHQIGYGTSMVSGPLIFAESAGPNNEFLHLVVPVAAHEIEAIDSVWLNDVEITNSQLDGSGNVTSGRFKDHARIKKHLGSDTQAADADLAAETVFEGQHDPATCPTAHDHTICAQVGANLAAPARAEHQLADMVVPAAAANPVRRLSTRSWSTWTHSPSRSRRPSPARSRTSFS